MKETNPRKKETPDSVKTKAGAKSNNSDSNNNTGMAHTETAPAKPRKPRRTSPPPILETPPELPVTATPAELAPPIPLVTATAGNKKPPATSAPFKKGPIPPTRDNIRAALSFLSPDLDREAWFRVLAAVKSALGEDGRDIAENWSEQGQSYSATDFRDTWKSITGNRKITIATLWRAALDMGWKPDREAHQETEAERQERERINAERAEKDAKKAAEKARRAARKTAGLRRVVTPATLDNPYLVKKGIKPTDRLYQADIERIKEVIGYLPESEGIPLSGLCLVAFVENGGAKPVTVEFIDETGQKSALAGGPKSGGYWTAQPLPKGDGAGETLAIGEGIATVLSTIQAADYAGLMGIAALSAGNLPKVATAMRDRYPRARLLIMGDIGGGLKYAQQAAKDTGAALAVPVFTPAQHQAHQERHDGKAPTDFNDLAALAGLDEVRNQIETAAASASAGKSTKPGEPTGAGETASTGEPSGAGETAKPGEPASPDTIKPTPNHCGRFVYTSDNGTPKLVIDSKGARIMAGLMRSDKALFAYDSESGAWHLYDGHCWAALQSPAEPERFALQALFKETAPIGFRQAYFNGILNIIQRAGLLPLPPKPEGKIPFKNGLLDIATRQLEPTTPANAATFFLPHNYTESADCPIFRGWLQSAMGNDEGLIQLLRAFIAAVITGRADMQKFLHLMGAGGTGKSTFIRLLFAIVGNGNAISTDFKQLEQNRFEAACLYGKPLVAITDSDKYGGSVNVLKALTGQDPIRNERKHIQQAGTFVFDGMVIVASNEPLASTDYTSGLERRRLVVKFDRRIPPHEKAAFLAAGGEDQLHREIPAIINWALELSREEVTAIFMNPPAKAAEAAFEALTAQNPIAEWITDNLIPAPGHWVGVGVKSEVRTQEGRTIFEDYDAKLYPNYLNWCNQNKREALSLRRFRHAAVDMLKTMGADVIESRRGSGQGVQGVRLRSAHEAFHPWGVGQVQDQSYTSTPASVGINGLEAAPVQDVQSVQDFLNTFVGKKIEGHSTPATSPAETFHSGESALVQDQSYTPTPASVGINGLQATPVQDVQSVQDFPSTFVGKKIESHSTPTTSPSRTGTPPAHGANDLAGLVKCLDCQSWTAPRSEGEKGRCGKKVKATPANGQLSGGFPIDCKLFVGNHSPTKHGGQGGKQT